MIKSLFLTILVALLLLFVSSGCGSEEEAIESEDTEETELKETVTPNTSEKDYEYEIENNEEAVITKYIGEEENVIIPYELEGLPVTTIGSTAFANMNGTRVRLNEDLKSVVIPNSVEAINGGAFISCVALESVEIGDGVTLIADSAFRDCTSLESVTIGNSVQRIENRAFEGCKSLKSVTIPDNVQYIGFGGSGMVGGTFKGCISLENITIGKNVKILRGRVFKNCTSIEEIVIPESVDSISPSAFRGCKSLHSVYFKGDAPEEFESGTFDDCADDFTIYFEENKSGWRTPLWNGYPTEAR